MPIHFTLVNDEVRVRYSGKYFDQYRAVISSFGFARFNGYAKAWVFPINMFDRISGILTSLPEPPNIEPKLIERLMDNKAATEFTKGLRLQTDCDFEPIGLKGKLYPFQKIGSLFLTHGRRVALTDDVGLGKTIQTIAAFNQLLEIGEIDSVLIICPGHLKRQWESEIIKFTNNIPTVIEGSPKKRQESWSIVDKIVITNYELLSRENNYHDREWGVVILDEAQNIKNYKTTAAKLCRKLQAQYKWALTATILENSLPELHSIFDFINPGLLGSWWEFERNFILRDEWNKIVEYRNIDKLQEMIKPYMLRRRVEDCISDFPSKDSKLNRLEFLPEEHAIYRDVLKQASNIFNTTRREQINESNKMTQVSYLRQACDNSLLVSDEFNYPSAKINWLKSALAEIRERGDSVVVFTEWSRMAKIICDNLDESFMMHGGMNFGARHNTIDAWKKSKAPLITTDCANVGLNLQNANWLISYEMHWNPAVMKQRVGRVYRLTQQKPVFVRTPMINNSVEEKVLEALTSKSDIFRLVVDAIASSAKKVNINAGRST